MPSAFADSGYTYAVTSETTRCITGYVGTENNLVIPNKIDGYSVTAIGAEAFSGTQTITGVVIPEGVVSIGEFAFDASCVKSITLPASVKTLGMQSFSNCIYLTQINLPEGLTDLPETVFAFCPALRTIVLPQSMKTIGVGAFAYCHALTYVNIPEGVKIFDDSTFVRCDSITSSPFLKA